MIAVTRVCTLLGVAAALTVATSASAQSWTAVLSGPAESPPNASPGTGFVTMSLTGNLFSLSVAFSNLTTPSTATHIHCCTPTPFTGTAGVATQVFPGFLFGTTSAVYSHTFNIANDELFTPAFVAANGGTTASAAAAFFAGMNSGEAYYNVHTTAVPGGEIRGFILVATPEPQTWVLVGTGLASIGLITRRRKRSAPTHSAA